MWAKDKYQVVTLYWQHFFFFFSKELYRLSKSRIQFSFFGDLNNRPYHVTHMLHAGNINKRTVSNLIIDRNRINSTFFLFCHLKDRFLNLRRKKSFCQVAINLQCAFIHAKDNPFLYAPLPNKCKQNWISPY